MTEDSECRRLTYRELENEDVLVGSLAKLFDELLYFASRRMSYWMLNRALSLVIAQYPDLDWTSPKPEGGVDEPD